MLTDIRSEMKVLLVDDSPIVLARLMTVLSELEGVDVVGQARDASEAIESFRTCTPDVAILDIRLPGTSGIELLRWMKREAPDVVLVMNTNFPEEQYRAACKMYGADYFFDKSKEGSKLVETLQNLGKYRFGPKLQNDGTI